MIRVPGTKTEGSRADVPMIPPLKAELRAHRARQRSIPRRRQDALVFQTANGRQLDRKDVLRSIYTAGDAAGLNVKAQKRVGCHDLRHSCAAVLFAAGVPATNDEAVLRHTTTRTTLTTYAGLAEADRGDLRRDLEAAFR